MEKREQVFVSSTYVDLVQERQKVIQTLLEAECFPVGMEMFPASDDEKWDLIKGVIDDSDYYVLIIGGRYGSEDERSAVEESKRLSYTEQEYDYAVSVKKPVMAFVHANPKIIPAGKTDENDQKASKLKQFREKVEARMVKSWQTPEELPGHVVTSLMKLRKSHPAVGWVRADQVITPELRAEVAELRAALAEKNVARPNVFMDVETLEQGEDQVTLSVAMVYSHKDPKSGTISRRRGSRDVTVRWNQILTEIGPLMFHEASEAEIDDKLSVLLYGEIPEDQMPKNVAKLLELDTGYGATEDVIVQFFALGLIERGTKKRGITDHNKYWSLTKDGQDRLMKLRARKREPVV